MAIVDHVPTAWRTWLLLTGAAATPGLLALAALAVGHGVTSPLAFATFVLLIGAAGAVAGWLMQHVLRLHRRIERLLDDSAPADQDAFSIFTDALDLLHRRGRTWRSDRAALARRIAALERLLDAFPHPLLTITDERRVAFANRTAHVLLADRKDGTLTGKVLAAALRPPEVLDAVAAVLDGAELRIVEFTLTQNVERHFQAHVVRITPGDRADAHVLLVLEDVTAARRAERMRFDFVANVSHELRTPLSTVVGFIETLRGPAREDTATHDRFLSLMDAQATRMTRLVEDLLSLSRIELEEHTPPRDDVDIANLVAHIAELLALPAREKQMQIDLELTEGLPHIVGDSDQLTQLFQNLIDNAIKYGSRGTPILVRATPAVLRGGAAGVTVSVIDRGEGIPAEHIPRLTERFYRVDAGRSRAHGGTGLGLAIVKHVVNRHHGHLRIKSKLGQGSTFTVELPAHADT